jgi:hypothetical protein
MPRPADTVVVKDDAGVPRQVHPIDGKEIVEQGGTYEVSKKEMAEAIDSETPHPIGSGGTEVLENVTEQPRRNVEAKAGEAARADPKTKADKEAGTRTPKK